MNPNEMIIGPGAEERERKLTPEGITLSGGRPLYHALLADPNAAILSTDETREAKSRLSASIEADADAVLSCEGKSTEDARAILLEIENRPSKQAA
ncbi:MAG: hypothetical protein AABY16_04930 [Nanoarchaeota archaeon]|mgnify:CR=1 FL=1